MVKEAMVAVAVAVADTSPSLMLFRGFMLMLGFCEVEFDAMRCDATAGKSGGFVGVGVGVAVQWPVAVGMVRLKII